MAPVLVAKSTSTLPAALIATSASSDFNHGTYTIAVNYKFNKEVMAYFTTRTGFTPGGTVTGAPAGTGFTNLQPEYVTDYELGVKGQHDFGSVRILGALDIYQDDFRNIQRNVTFNDPTTGRPLSFLANVGKVRIRGVDLDATLDYAHWFQLTARVTLNDPKIQQLSTVFQNTFPTLNLFQDHLANLSETTWSVTPTIRLKELTDGKTPDLVLSANIYRQSPYGEVEPNIGALAGNLIPAYTLADLRLDWFNIAGSNFSAAAVIKNIADYNGEIVGHSFATSIGFNVISVAVPRDFYVQLHYKF
jgi:iron complex outermembrane receptor protein